MIVRGVSMSNIATNRSPVSHHRISYHRRGIQQNGVAVADEARTIQIGLASHSTNVQYTVRLLDILQAINTVDVDQDRWPRKTETQEGNEAQASGEDFGFIAMLVQ